MGLTVLGHGLLAHAGSATHPWAFHAHPDVWALMAFIVVGYVCAVRYVGPHKAVPGEPLLTRRQGLLFGLGVLALWVHADWPVHDIGEGYLFSVHMIQHTGFTLIAPPLLLLGMPGWMTRWLFVDNPKVHAVAKRVLRPLPAAIVYNLVTVLTHWPVVVNASLTHHPLHFGVHVVLFFSAAAMWFPVLNRVPELPTMSPPLRMLYLFLQSVIPTIPASFLTFGDRPLYSYYAHVPHVLHLSAVDDQQLAGALMKVYAGSILWGVIIGVFFRWYAAEQPPRRRPDAVLTWDDVQMELDRSSPAG
ncbi:MAG: putative rane protein [Acidimicrobiaceae bacterium]|nr:putative rane protein [Acidimicrobiaceae bacterium]MDQ1444952.1 putative rane protein [Acidimicrobiaceae bacterium]